MFNRDWRNGLALGLVVGICLTILASITFSFMQSPNYLAQAAGEQDQASDESEVRPDGWLLTLLRRLVITEDTPAQWIMAAFTIFATYLLLRTLWATQKMAEDTRRIGEAQVRAYLTIEDVTVVPNPDNNAVHWKVTVTIRNCGQSPARDVEAFVIVDEDGRPATTAIVRDLAAGGDSRENLKATSTIKNVKFISDTRVSFIATVVVKFRDVFSEEDSPPLTEIADFVGLFDLVPEEFPLKATGRSFGHTIASKNN